MAFRSRLWKVFHTSKNTQYVDTQKTVLIEVHLHMFLVHVLVYDKVDRRKALAGLGISECVTSSCRTRPQFELHLDIIGASVSEPRF